MKLKPERYNEKKIRRYSIIRIAPALLFFLALSAGCRQAGKDADAAFAVLSSRLEAVRSANELMGMSVLVVDGGEVVYEGGFGLADLGRQLPATANTIYRLASISKSVTATAVMMLYEQGELDIDADVSRYLDFSLRNPHHPEQPITLRLLLSHRSSIRDGAGYFAFSRAMFERPLSLRDLFRPGGEFYTDDLFMDHEPGAFFTYANCPWGIIASVVERVSGRRFDEFCRLKIFEPLGMDAAFDVRQLRQFDSLAVLYRVEEGEWRSQADDFQGQRPVSGAGEGYRLGSNGLLFGPQGSLRASVHDLSRFMLMHLHDGEYGGVRVLKEETAKMMHAAEWSYDGQNGDTYHDFFFSWGLGFHRITRRESKDIVFPDRDMTGHPGEAYGLISDMYFDKATRSGVIFATNGSRKEFAYGERTAFYRPEEAAFEAIYEFLGSRAMSGGRER